MVEGGADRVIHKDRGADGVTRAGMCWVVGLHWGGGGAFGNLGWVCGWVGGPESPPPSFGAWQNSCSLGP